MLPLLTRLPLVAGAVALAFLGSACLEDTSEGTTGGVAPPEGCPEVGSIPALAELSDDARTFDVSVCGDVVYQTGDAIVFRDAALRELGVRTPEAGTALTALQVLGDSRTVMWAASGDAQGGTDLFFSDLARAEAEPRSVEPAVHGPTWYLLEPSAPVVLVTDGDTLQRVDVASGSVVELEDHFSSQSLQVNNGRALWSDVDGGVWWAGVTGPPTKVTDIITQPLVGDTYRELQFAWLSRNGAYAMVQRKEEPIPCSPLCPEMTSSVTVIRLEDGATLASDVPGSAQPNLFAGPDQDLPAVFPTFPGYSALMPDGSVVTVTEGSPSAALTDGRLVTTSSNGSDASFVITHVGDDPSDSPVILAGTLRSAYSRTDHDSTWSVIAASSDDCPSPPGPGCVMNWTVFLVRSGVPGFTILARTVGQPDVDSTSSGAVAVTGEIVELGDGEPSGDAIAPASTQRAALFDADGALVWSLPLDGVRSPRVRPAGDLFLVVLSEPGTVGQVAFSELWVVDPADGAAKRLAESDGLIDARSDRAGRIVAFMSRGLDGTRSALFAGALERP